MTSDLTLREEIRGVDGRLEWEVTTTFDDPDTPSEVMIRYPYITGEDGSFIVMGAQEARHLRDILNRVFGKGYG